MIKNYKIIRETPEIICGVIRSTILCLKPFIGAGLQDSPAGLAAYILEKFSSWTDMKNRNRQDGGLSIYDLDKLLSNVMIYWTSGTITSSMRLYKEFLVNSDLPVMMR